MNNETKEIKQKIIERLKKLSQEEQDKREKIQETKLEGGDSIDNQDYQFNLESLLRIQQQKAELKERLEQLEQLEQIQQTQVTTKSKSKKSEEYFSLLGKKFKLEVNHNNKTEIIQIEIVSLYEEIEINNEDNIYRITTESPLAKAIKKYLNEVKDISKLKNIEFTLNINEKFIKYKILESLN
ncbi:MAG: hypothetical protein N2485_04435 [bacterium]|nr:hypothetical protein [bacterium]